MTEDIGAHEWIEIEGRNKHDTLERACNALNTTLAYMEYEVLEGECIKIRARKIDQLREGEVEQKPRKQISAEQARDWLEEIVQYIDDNASVEMHEKDDEIVLDIQANGTGLLIGKHGQTLEALQHLLAKMLGLDRSIGKRLVIDSEQYRQRRKENLESLARRLAARVRRERRSMTMEPMNAVDRRILHMALKDDRDVVTKSVGEGESRKVMILPRQGGGTRNNGPRPQERRGRFGEGRQDRSGMRRPRADVRPARLHDSYDVPSEPDMDIVPEDVELMAESIESQDLLKPIGETQEEER